MGADNVIGSSCSHRVVGAIESDGVVRVSGPSEVLVSAQR